MRRDCVPQLFTLLMFLCFFICGCFILLPLSSSPITQNSKSQSISLVPHSAIFLFLFFPVSSVMVPAVCSSLICASLSPPLCSALVSRAPRADLVRNSVRMTESMKRRKARGRDQQIAITQCLVKLVTLIQYKI